MVSRVFNIFIEDTFVHLFEFEFFSPLAGYLNIGAGFKGSLLEKQVDDLQIRRRMTK